MIITLAPAMTIEMLIKMGLFATLVLVCASNNHEFNDAYSLSSCCIRKDVGAYRYFLLGTDSIIPHQNGCSNMCIYARADKPGSRFCFRKGELESKCLVDGSFDSILLTGGYDNGSLALTELYPASPKCILPDLPRTRDDHVSFTTNSGLMAICGGNHESVGLIEGSGETTASCLVLNTSSMKWEKDSRIPDLPSPRYGSTSVSLPDIGVFILGGAHHNGNSSLLLRTGSSSWIPGPMIPDGVAWDACCVALKAFSFLLIGTGDYPDYHKVREYRADTETWEPVEKWPRLNKGRFGHACSIIGSKVVITGGNGTAGGPHISSTELIDLNQRTLSSGGPLNTPRVFPAMATIGHEGSKNLYVIGGRTEPWIGLDSVEKWQESTETWILDGKIAAKKQSMGVIPIKKNLVCKG